MTKEERDSRTRILDAGEAAFADAGFAGARVAAIAREAGVNKAMLYYYFDSKEALYKAVLARVFDQIAALAQHTWRPDVEPSAETIRGFLEGYRGILASRPRFARLLLREFADGAHHAVPILGPRIQSVLPIISGAMARAQAQGMANPKVAPEVVGPVVVAPLLFFALTGPVLAGITGMPLEALSDRYHQTVIEMLLHGLVTPESSP